MKLEFSIFKGTKVDWNKGIGKFENSTMYQIYEWGEFESKNGWNILRLIGLINKKEVSYTQILVKKKYGINYISIPGGPVGNLELWFPSIIKYISIHFGFLSYTRIACSYPKENKIINFINKTKWKKPFFKTTPEKTFFLKLENNSKKIKQACTNNWRYGLNRSIKNNLQLILIKKPKADKAYNIYNEMEKNKKLPQTYSLKQIKNMFYFFIEKIIYYECYNSKNELIAIRGAIYNNDKAWEVLAASTLEGRKLYASYFTEWALIDYFCKIGVKLYDFTGSDKKNNPGVYFFKKGTGANDTECLGEWEFSLIPLYQYIIYLRVKIIYFSKSILKIFKHD